MGNKVTAYGATLGNEASQDTYVDLLGLNVYDLPVGVLAGGYNHRHVFGILVWQALQIPMKCRFTKAPSRTGLRISMAVWVLPVPRTTR